MTTIEAVSRLARHHTRKNFSALSVPEVVDAMQALNVAAQELYQRLPPAFRQRTVRLLVPAPRGVSLVAASGGANLGVAVFNPDEVGRSVVSSGDSVRHRVAGPATLADAWLGAAGAHQATVFGDAIAGDGYPFERLVSGPALLLGDGRERILAPMDPIEQERHEPSLLGGIGEPRAYRLEPQGNSQGAEPIILLRLFPLPDRAYRIRYVASFAPPRIHLPDLEAASPLPVPDHYADALIGLAVPHLAGLPGWTVNPASARALRDAALNFIDRNRLPLGSAANRVGTPRGY